MIKKLNKISQKLQQTSQDSSKESSDFKKTSEISKADEKQKLERDMDNQQGVSN